MNICAGEPCLGRAGRFPPSESGASAAEVVSCLPPGALPGAVWDHFRALGFGVRRAARAADVLPGRGRPAGVLLAAESGPESVWLSAAKLRVAWRGLPVVAVSDRPAPADLRRAELADIALVDPGVDPRRLAALLGLTAS